MELLIKDLMVNRMKNPLGQTIGDAPRLNWIVEAHGTSRGMQTHVEIALDKQFRTLIFDSSWREDINGISYKPGHGNPFAKNAILLAGAGKASVR